MTTTDASSELLDVSGTAPVPFSRLVSVEVRKALDTRAGRWLIISILALIVVVEVIYSFAADDGMKNLDDYLQIPGAIFGFFLPILLILMVTSEWSQRTGLTTFTMVPSRSRVVLAKLLDTVLVGIVSILVALAVGAVGNVVAGLFDGGYGPTEWTQLLVTGTIWLLLPLAFGLWRVLRSEVK